jgi:hypothetical protein
MAVTIKVAHDEETGVFFVRESQVPGLNAESGTLDGLISELRDLVPELLAANGSDLSRAGGEIALSIETEIYARPLHAA